MVVSLGVYLVGSNETALNGSLHQLKLALRIDLASCTGKQETGAPCSATASRIAHTIMTAFRRRRHDRRCMRQQGAGGAGVQI